MRVAIVGAGALGSVYAARLALGGGCDVDVVARSARPLSRVRLERVSDGEVLEWAPRETLDRVPPGAEVTIVCVRYEDLDSVVETSANSAATVVILTPMMPREHAKLALSMPGRVIPAMPSVVAYRNERGAVRYWLPRGAATLIDARGAAAAQPVVTELVARLGHSGIAARREVDVLSRNVATTVSFFPLAMALDAAGGLDALLGDAALLALGLEATEEGCELGRSVGKAEAWATMLLRFLGPLTLKAGVALARARAPEALRYVDEHFGRKLKSQNVAIGAAMVELAQERGTLATALKELLRRLKETRG
jgi:Ketopantoate reductase PanE/ApbA